MGKTFDNLTWDDLCDLMCGGPEDDIEDSGAVDIGNRDVDNRLHMRENRVMRDCTECEYAEWDYETYYGTTQKQYFVCGCKLNKEPERCGEGDEE